MTGLHAVMILYRAVVVPVRAALLLSVLMESYQSLLRSGQLMRAPGGRYSERRDQSMPDASARIILPDIYAL